jgi:hypothetical protein
MKGRSINKTCSASLPGGTLYRHICRPTMSVISLRCELTCDRIIESAVGLIISRRCRWIVTMETWTGAVTPTPGRISTFPSNRG